MDDLYQKLLESSFRYISFRPRSEKEIRDFLLKKLHKRKETDTSTIERVVARLRELDYVNDEKFATWWVDQRQTHTPKGMRLISRELKTKGVTVEIKSSDEGELARQAIAKKLPLWRKLSKLEQKKKIYGFLGRRGFDTETIRHVIDEIVNSKVE